MAYRWWDGFFENSFFQLWDGFVDELRSQDVIGALESPAINFYGSGTK